MPGAVGGHTVVGKRQEQALQMHEAAVPIGRIDRIVDWQLAFDRLAIRLKRILTGRFIRPLIAVPSSSAPDAVRSNRFMLYIAVGRLPLPVR